MAFDDLTRVAPLWVNLSLAIFLDEDANREWGWVQVQTLPWFSKPCSGLLRLSTTKMTFMKSASSCRFRRQSGEKLGTGWMFFAGPLCLQHRCLTEAGKGAAQEDCHLGWQHHSALQPAGNRKMVKKRKAAVAGTQAGYWPHLHSTSPALSNAACPSPILLQQLYKQHAFTLLACVTLPGQTYFRRQEGAETNRR